MNITKLDIEISAEEVKERFDALGIQREDIWLDIENPGIELGNGKVIVTCTLNPAFCSRTVATAEFELKPRRSDGVLIVCLRRVQARVAPLGGVFGSLDFDGDWTERKIMEAISHAVTGRDGYAVDGKSLIVDLKTLLKDNKFISLQSQLIGVNINPSRIAMQFSNETFGNCR